MRHFTSFVFAIGLALFLATSAHAETISPQEASHHVGATMTVEGEVSQVSTSGGGTTFINFGGRFPNHVFYAVIFRKNINRFSDVHSLVGNSVSITGAIELYKGKPQIILSTPEQIQLR